MDSSKIKTFIIVVAAALFALYLGIAAATAQMEAIAWVAGALGIVFVLALGKHVWVLIPICLQLGGVITFLPGSPSPWWGAVAVVGVIFALRFLLRKNDFQFRFTWLEFAIFLQMVAVAQAFARNPTGLSVLGGELVGGKPYIIFAFSFIAFALLSVVKADLRIIKWVVICSILMAVMDGGLMLASLFVPSIAMAVLPLYSGVSFTSATTGGGATDALESRLDGAKDIGKSLAFAAFTLFRPISTLNPLHPIRFLLMASSLSFILISGFRSVLAQVFLVAIVSSLIRRKFLDVIVCGVIAMLGLMLLVVSGQVEKLPYGAQRILSVLPINVRHDIRVDAEGSANWRFEMWELALTTDRYISNKWLGDGFAYRADEHAMMMDAVHGSSRSHQTNQASQDLMMAKGSYHGFHVEAIRMTGAFGLLCALIALGIFFRYAWIQIQYFRGRPEWPYVLWICIPFLIHPFYLMLIFGAYRHGFPALLVAAAMLKVLDNIRVTELATVRAETPVALPNPSQARARSLPPGRLPQPAMKTK